MSRNKKQHWVPGSYLEAWVDPVAPPNYDPFVHLFDRTGANHRTKSPGNIFKMIDLYTIVTDGQRNLSIEDYFSRREQEFVRVRRIIEAGEAGDSRDVAALYAFTAAMIVRPPDVIQHYTRQWGNIVRKARTIRINPAVKPISNLKGEGMTLDEAQRMADDPMGTWFPVALNAHIQVLTQSFGADILLNRSPYPFMTSDRPASVVFPDRDEGAPRFPRGLGTEGCEIFLPLSPSAALRFSHQEPGIQNVVEVDWETVFEINFLTITRAKMTIVSDRKNLFYVQAILDRVAAVEGSGNTIPS